MRLALHTWGSPDAGRTALLIHGALSSHSTWSRVAAEFAGRGYHVIAPDLRGHGASPWADSYTGEDYAADLVESLPKSVDLALGHSIGARALLLAVDALAPEKAVYNDPSWFRRPESYALLREFGPASKVISQEQLRQMNPRWTIEEVAAEWADYQAWDSQVIDGAELFKDMDIPAPAVPSLVVAADPSVPITPEAAEYLTGLGYTIRVVKDTRHVVHRDDLQGFMTALDGWI
ncbi:MAG TPA: alpha/beta fold hydrolase [Streptosporangiaceae bacterium]|jgi:pimeloyl-ACP methyl ester carboxylesterase